MTLYERLCAYVSPRWYNYQDILDKRYDQCEARIERTLDVTCIDSYLGRLLDLSVHINHNQDKIDATNFEAWLVIRTIIADSVTIRCRSLTTKMKLRIQEYLNMGFPSEWILNLLDVFRLSFFTANKYQTLNNPLYLETLKRVYAVKDTYYPVAEWFKTHPEALNKESQYKEVSNGQS